MSSISPFLFLFFFLSSSSSRDQEIFLLISKQCDPQGREERFPSSPSRAIPTLYTHFRFASKLEFRSLFSSFQMENFEGFKISTIALFIYTAILLICPPFYLLKEVKRLRFRWRQQYRCRYPDELLDKSNSRGRGDYQMDYEPAPRITEADKRNDRKSLQRALDKRLYLLLYGKAVGAPSGKPVWHFPEKVHDSEKTMRKCAESALASVIGDLSRTYFVGNAPMGHMVIQPTEHESDASSYKRFFF